MSFDPKLLKRIRKEFPAADHDPAGRKRAFPDNGAEGRGSDQRTCSAESHSFSNSPTL
jgi:hypothetical protein